MKAGATAGGDSWGLAWWWRAGVGVGTAVLGESLASAWWLMMMMPSRRRLGSVAHYLSVSPLYLSVSFLFFFPSSFTFSVRFTAEFFFFFFYLHGSWALASWAARLGLEFMIFGRGGLSKKLRGPSLYFLGKFNLLNFFWAQGSEPLRPNLGPSLVVSRGGL